MSGMFMVDNSKDIAQISKWGFTNLDDEVEYVQLNNNCVITSQQKRTVSIFAYSCEDVPFYVDDIPNLIKALQAAYQAAKEN